MNTTQHFYNSSPLASLNIEDKLRLEFTFSLIKLTIPVSHIIYTLGDYDCMAIEYCVCVCVCDCLKRSFGLWLCEHLYFRFCPGHLSLAA